VLAWWCDRVFCERTGIVAGIAVGALVLANVVAFLPGRLAARTPVASLLHSE